MNLIKCIFLFIFSSHSTHWTLILNAWKNISLIFSSIFSGSSMQSLILNQKLRLDYGVKMRCENICAKNSSCTILNWVARVEHFHGSNVNIIINSHYLCIKAWLLISAAMLLIRQRIDPLLAFQICTEYCEYIPMDIAITQTIVMLKRNM